MLTYTFERNSGQPIYLQLYEKIKQNILCGKILPDEKLPSKRTFAKHLSISVMTIQNAYDQLIAEGYIYARQKQGYYAAELQASPLPAHECPEIGDVCHGCEMAQVPMPSSSTPFPLSTWSKLMRRVIIEHGESLMRHTPWNGVFELRRAISDYLSEFRGMNTSPEQIVIGAGTEYLYGLIIQLLGRSRIYAVENPGYPKLRQILNANDAEFRSISIDEYGMSLEELKGSDADIIHISPAHHYPTGVVMPIARRQALLKWAACSSERYIIEDDYDSEFRYRGKPIPTVFGIDSSEKVIYTNTFSKTISPSMRISYMVLPPRLLNRYREKLGFYSCTVPAFDQLTLAKFISEGYFERHINRSRNYYRQIRDDILDEFADELQLKDSCISETDSGLHFLITTTDKEKIGKLYSLAQRLNLTLADINSYCSKPSKIYRDSIVVGYQNAVIPDSRS